MQHTAMIPTLLEHAAMPQPHISALLPSTHCHMQAHLLRRLTETLLQLPVQVASKSYCVAYLDLAHDYYGSEEQSANMAEADSLTKLLLAAAEGKSSLPFTTKLQQFVKPFIVGNGYDKLHLGWVLFVPDRPIYVSACCDLPLPSCLLVS